MMVTTEKMVRRAFELAKVLDHQEDMSDDLFRRGRDVLAEMLMDWQEEDGLHWLERDAFLVLEPGRHVYRFGPGGDFPEYVTEFVTFSITDGVNGSDVTIREVGRDQYREKPRKAQLGRPVEFMSAESDQCRDVYFWPRPDRPYTFSFSYRGLLQVPSSRREALPIPPGWERAVRYNLAMELAEEYGIESPKVDALAMELKQKKLDTSREGLVLEVRRDRHRSERWR